MTFWTTKLNTATNRRLEKLEKEGVKIDTATHQVSPGDG